MQQVEKKNLRYDHAYQLYLFGENAFTLRPSKMSVGLFLYWNRCGEI